MAHTIHHTTGKFRSFDGTAINYHCWQPSEGYNAVILLQHGLGEHSARYHNFVNFFTQQNFAVFATDLRGHGKSEGKKGCIHSFEDFIKDLYRFRWYFSRSFQGKSLYLYGHSLGGLIAYIFALKHSDGLNGLILSSPFFDIEVKVPAIKKISGKCLANIFPNA